MNDKVPCSSTKLIRGGTAYSSSPFQLNLQLHEQVSNPYSFGIKQNYKSSATTKVSIPPYTEKSWTTPGTYTWTVPAGVTRIRVAVCGGGGGGAYAVSENATGGNGNTSSFDTIQATGGTGGWLKGDADGISDSEYGNGGTPNGVDGSNRIEYTAGFALDFSKKNGTYGRGGGGKTNIGYYIYVRSGGSGGYNSTYKNVSSNKSYTIKVASGGSAGGRISNVSNAGTSGFVLIAYGEGIE